MEIEEMAKVLGEIQEFGINRPRDEERYPVLYPNNKEVADYLISKSYRKASDVAREIFAEIDMLIDLHKENTPTHIPFCYIDSKFVYRLDKLKKKYTEGNV